MRAVGAIVWEQFQVCFNGTFELRSGLGRERCGVGQGGVGLGKGETVVLSSKFWDSYNESTSSFILYEAGPVDCGCAI